MIHIQEITGVSRKKWLSIWSASFSHTLKKKEEEFNLPNDQKVMLVFHVFKGQKTQHVKKIDWSKPFAYRFIYHRIWHEFQALDLSINDIAKKFLNKKISDWYANRLQRSWKKARCMQDRYAHYYETCVCWMDHQTVQQFTYLSKYNLTWLTAFVYAFYKFFVIYKR